MQPTLKIRKATLGDAAVIAEFNTLLARETEELQLEPATINAGVAAVLSDSSKGIYFVAEDAQAGIIGQLMITYEWSDWRNATIWWIQSVYVREDFRGRGVFKALFEYLTRLAHEAKDVCSLRLYMERDNEAARQSYRKLGMKEMSYEVLEFVIE